MSLPISEELLVHSATLATQGGYDDYGNPVAGEPVLLSKVRVSHVKQTLITQLGEAKSDKLTLFYDCSLSQPQGTTFKENDFITYQDIVYRVREVSAPPDDTAKPLYYRIELVGS